MAELTFKKLNPFRRGVEGWPYSNFCKGMVLLS